MENYDEDLAENIFFQILQTDHAEVFRRATVEGWIICVPRAGSVPKYALTPEDFLGHILIPSEELPESHFRTLSDKEVRILNRVVTVQQENISRPYITHILFEETYYNDDLKYKVLCVENPLERLVNIGTSPVDSSHLYTINTLRDCIDFLWTECGGPEILEKIDQHIKIFCTNNERFEFEPLQSQKDILANLYIECLKITLQNTQLQRKKIFVNKNLLENVKLSVETYVHHGTYPNLIKGITACTALENSQLNKVIRNLCDIQLKDLGIRTDLYNAIPRAKQELARIDCYSTVLGKLGCLRRTVTVISQQNDGELKEVNICNAVSADDLLPAIVFLVIKTGLPNWIAHLTYMKQFHFSASMTDGVDEYSFLVTSLEAALEHIKSGVLLGPSDPEAQIDHDYINYQEVNASDLETTKSVINEGNTFGIGFFFDQIRLGNIHLVKEILEKKTIINESSNIQSVQLCHPLCSCDKCENILSKHMCDTRPTIHSCDDRGFTPLHVAGLYGQASLVDLFISYGTNVDATDYSSSTALHYAAAKGHQHIVFLLVHAGCNMMVQDSDGNTPLHFASNNGHEGCVKALLYLAEYLGRTLDVNRMNNFGDTPLHHASRWGYEGIVQILLDYGAQPNLQNKRHLSSMDVAHSWHISRLLAQILVKNHSTRNFKFTARTKCKTVNNSVAGIPSKTLDFLEEKESDTKSKNAQTVYRPQSSDQMKLVEKILRAIAQGDSRLACFYLGLEGPVQENETKSSDLQLFCHPLCICEKCRPCDSSGTNFKKNKPDKKIMNVNICNAEGFTPLHIASLNGHTEMVQLLLDSGAHTNVRTRSKGLTPLHLACQTQRISVVELLLQTNDCDVNIQDVRGNTPLHYACYTNNLRLVKLVLKSSPYLNVKNVNGKTPREEAEENVTISLVHLLRNAESSHQHSL